MCIIYIYIYRYDIYVLLSFGNSLKDEGRVEFLDSNLSKALQRQRLWSGGLSFGLSHLGQQHSTRFGYLVNCFGGLCNPSDAEKNIMDMIWKWKCVDEVIFMVRCAIYLCVFFLFVTTTVDVVFFFAAKNRSVQLVPTARQPPSYRWIDDCPSPYDACSKWFRASLCQAWWWIMMNLCIVILCCQSMWVLWKAMTKTQKW